MSHASGKTNSIQTDLGVKRQPGSRCAGFTAPQLLIVLTIVGLLGGYFVPRFEFAAGVNAKSETQPATAQAAAAGNCTQPATAQAAAAGNCTQSATAQAAGAGNCTQSATSPEAKQ